MKTSTKTTKKKAPKVSSLRDTFADRFAKLAPMTSLPKGARLLAVQLNGFSHKAFIDAGSKSSPVQCLEYSGCMPEGRFPALARDLFHDIGHAGYQGAPEEIVYILPVNR